MTSRTYRLPFPPSINTYWRRGGNCTYLTENARAFRSDVVSEVAERNASGWKTPPQKLMGRLAVNIELTMPSRLRRDIDNHVKAVLDALQHAGCFADDEQIDELRVKRLQVEAPGCCDVTIVEIGEPTC